MKCISQFANEPWVHDNVRGAKNLIPEKPEGGGAASEIENQMRVAL